MREAELYPNFPEKLLLKSYDQLLSYYSEREGSDITVQSDEPVFVEIYGKLKCVTRRRLSHSEVTELINSIYGANASAHLMGGNDIDTNYRVRIDRELQYRYRLNATSCLVNGHHGIQITARTIPQEPPPLANLALPEGIVSQLYPEQGVVYITGATGSGKSTLLASIIREIITSPEQGRKILTYEAPIEFVFDGLVKGNSIVSQSEIPLNLPSFSAGVRNALRRKPGLILVGEARDPETINAVMDAAMTGHPVYTTLHSNGVSETIRRLVNSFPRSERQAKTLDIIDTTSLILWQKLVPSIDGHRVALREYLVIDDQVKDLLLNDDMKSITRTCRKILYEFGRPMSVDSKEKYDAGIISKRTYDLLQKQNTCHDSDAEIALMETE